MKKNTRGRGAQSKPKKLRGLTLSRDTVRVLSTDDLARAAGGSGCDTTTWPTKTLQSNGGVAG